MSILIVGLGASGEACARFCLEVRDSGLALDVTVVDAGDTAALQQRAESLRDAGATVFLGAEEVTGTFDLAVVSPGVPPSAPLFVAAQSASAEMISEIEFAFRESDTPWIAVTGTNGKTTVTSLIGHILTRAGVAARVVGNIGLPATSAVAETGPAGVLVAEVSSFQLALTKTFHPRVAVLLNITPDHLDWHGDMATYTADKAKIFENMGDFDTAVIDIDDAGSAAFVEPVSARGVNVAQISHSSVPSVGGGIDAEGFLVLATPSGPLRLIHSDKLKIRGPHNVSNACAAAVAATAFGVTDEAVRDGLVTFMPLEHRLEPAGIVDGIEFFNDSKATNPDAALKAVAAFAERPTVILLGGRNKDFSFDALAAELGERGVRAVVFGEAADEIASALSSHGVPYEATPGLRAAVEAGVRAATPGGVVVLSPACASFDEFSSYAERGRVFKDTVARLMGEGD